MASPQTRALLIVDTCWPWCCVVLCRVMLCCCQDKLLAAQQQYQVLKQRNQAELTRLNLRRAEDFNRALGRFAALQAQAAAAAADVWSGVAEQFAQQ